MFQNFFALLEVTREVEETSLQLLSSTLVQAESEQHEEFVS